jgi:hypothetical protein
MNTAPDWHWFAQNPDRNFRMRVATHDELADLRSRNRGALDWELAPGCFIYSLVRIRREEPRLEMLLLVWEADGADMTEAECQRAWFKSSRTLGGKVEGLQQ